MTRNWPILAVLAVLVSCGPKNADQHASNDLSNGEFSVVHGDSGGLPSDTSEDTTHMKAPDSVVLSRRTVSKEDAVLWLTVPEILRSSEYVGMIVRVEGKCLGYGKIVAVGGPPLTRSDWQLEDGGVAIYVSGPLPEDCSATKGSTQRSIIYALVAEDTLRTIGSRPATPRRYLVRLLEEPGDS